MLTAAALLGIAAVLLAWPVPIALARARWPARAPGTALLVWQAIALAGGLSMISSLLVFGLAPFGSHPAEAVGGFWRALLDGQLPPSATFPEMFALSGALLLGVHLVLNLALNVVRTRQQRLRHLQLVELLSTPVPEQPGLRLLDHDAPIAYCLPATPRSITVLSAGLLAVLDDDEVRAVVAHEQAHVDQRHHLVVVAFEAWRGALPWFPIATRSLDAVGLLVEMLADDQARRTIPDRTLASAITTVGSGGGTEPHDTAPAVDPESLDRRVARLTNGYRPLGGATRLAIGAGALLVVLGPAVALVSPPVW